MKMKKRRHEFETRSLKVSGMHCSSCELRVRQALQGLSGVRIASLSFAKGRVTLESDGSAAFAEAEKRIADLGFAIIPEGEERSWHSSPSALEALRSLLWIGIVFVAFSQVDLSALFPALATGTSTLSAFLLGLVASVSTCLALVGGIVLGLGSLWGKKETLLARATPQLLFQAGRIGGFILLGGSLGFAGQEIGYTNATAGALSVAVGAVLLVLALHILGLLPSPARLGLTLPQSFSAPLFHVLARKTLWVAPVAGLLTFFLPCGFTQSVQLMAVSSRSFQEGSLLMAAFALGTFPILFAVGMGAGAASLPKFPRAKKAVGIVVACFALFSMNSGLVLSGAGSLIPTRGDVQVAIQKERAQSISMDIDWNFQNTKFQLRKGIPVEWEIRARNLTGCSNEIVIPALEKRIRLQPHTTSVLRFTPPETGKLTFSCWMGMLFGEINVVD